ncbi:MAG: helix-turn-helix transcriptional regulator [Roseburia sp.]|nr:helix-turn-helix transcriptional regulator [Roseburia sp.]
MDAVKVRNYNKDKATLGSNISNARKKLGISGTELAGRIGSDKSAVSKLENGERSPNFETLLKIADALETSVETLVHSETSCSSTAWLQEIKHKLDVLPPESQKSVKIAITAMIDGFLIKQGIIPEEM